MIYLIHIINILLLFLYSINNEWIEQFNEEIQLRQAVPKEKNAIEVVQLEKQNERLKTALIK